MIDVIDGIVDNPGRDELDENIEEVEVASVLLATAVSPASVGVLGLADCPVVK